MGWRLHLSSQPIASVQFVSGHTPQIAVWDSRHNVHFYDRRDAMPLGELHFADHQLPGDMHDESWREVTARFRAPDGTLLPVIFMSGLTVYQSGDGRLRLYHYQTGRLSLEIEGRHIALNQVEDDRFLVAGLDRALGLSGALTDEGQLYIFQQHVRVGEFDLGFSVSVDARLTLLAPEGTGTLVISDGERVVMTDSAGSITHEINTHFTVGPVAVSPDGKLVVLADIDDNLIRVYQGDLRPTHQKHAIDLVADAKQVQLLASLPGRKAALAALDVANDGTIVFALGGVVCVTSMEALDALPQPKPLM